MSGIGEFKLIKVADIDTSDRLRPIDPIFVEALAASIIRDGLLSPIDICQLPNQASGLPCKLVAGGHRIEAVKYIHHQKLQWDKTEIPENSPVTQEWKWRKSEVDKAIKLFLDADNELIIPSLIRSNAVDERRSREIAENLFKGDLKPLERATFIAELHEIERRRCGLKSGQDGRTVSARARWEKADARGLADGIKDATDTMSVAYGFTSTVAAKVGLTARTIRRDMELLRIPASIVSRLQAINCPVLENASQLKTISKMPPDLRDAFVETLEDGACEVKDAFKKYTISKDTNTQTPTQKREAAFIGAWTKMTTHERAAMMEFLSGKEPEGYKIVKGGGK